MPRMPIPPTSVRTASAEPQSTGPKTTEGKSVVSANACKHGARGLGLFGIGVATSGGLS